MKIILASSSAARKKILESLKLDFELAPSNLDEDHFKNISNPILLVKTLAKKKAETVAQKLKEGEGREAIATQVHPSFSFSYLVIAADSVVVFRGKVIGKPKNKSEAEKILRKLSGRTHQLLTGLCVINTKHNRVYQKVVSSRVTFRKISSEEISDYLKVVDPTALAGGYSLEPPQVFIEKIEGSLTNVLGLPLEALLPILKENGVKM